MELKEINWREEDMIDFASHISFLTYVNHGIYGQGALEKELFLWKRKKYLRNRECLKSIGV